MPKKLIDEEGNLKGLELSLEEATEWVIGRDPESCSLVIEDPSVSRSHLLLQETTEGLLCKNLSETNPVLVNDTPVDDPVVLKDGDQLKIGSETFRYISDEEAEITNHEEKEEEEEASDSLYKEETDEDKGILAEIDLELTETGRFLLKVISGPNTGAEFSMQKGSSYIIGTDPASCDVVFHDTSVSRQHSKLTVKEDETLVIEDLGSRNGTLIDAKKITEKSPFETNTLITLGTTTFVVYDREGEMHTIISPILPEIVKVLQKEEEVKKREKEHEEAVAAIESKPSPEEKEEKSQTTFGAFIITGILLGVFVIAGIGLTTLFQGDEKKIEKEYEVTKELDKALAPFPSIRYSFNKNTGKLLLVGHVLTGVDKNQLMYNLQGLPFIKSVDDRGIVIDEGVWREINQILARHTKWKGVTIHSPRPGSFVMTGYLKTRSEADDLNDYITANFNYPDLLERKIVVEEDVINSVEAKLASAGMRNIDIRLDNGELTLTGGVTQAKKKEFDELAANFKQIPGVRGVKQFITEIGPEASLINITNKYDVSGISRQGVNVSVVINGRILTKGDVLDGMRITDIRPKFIMLEKDGIQYRIDYSQ